MRVFVTGATGFVGAHVARVLSERRHEVHALVQEGAEEARLARERLGPDVSIEWIEGDLLRPKTFCQALEKLRPEACVHLGWYANPKDYLSSRINIELLGASAALAETLIDLGCRRLVGIGTCFEYDTSLGLLSEGSALSPRHLYSTCKRALFDIITQLVSGTTTSFAWARLFFLHGPHEHPARLVPQVVDALLSGRDAPVTTGAQIRDYLHVADAARAIVHVLETDSLVGPVNVASGRPTAVREVIETIRQIVERHYSEGGGARPRVRWGAIEARPHDPPFVCADITKLSSSGFRSEHDLERGLADTIAWRAASRTRQE